MSLCEKFSSSLPKKDFYYLTSVCYRYLNEPTKALLNLDKLIQIDLTYGRAYQEIGHNNVLLKNQDKALKNERFVEAKSSLCEKVVFSLRRKRPSKKKEPKFDTPIDETALQGSKVRA